MNKSEPNIFGINPEVSRHYSFYIEQNSDRSIPGGSTIDNYKVKVNIYRYVKGKYLFMDGSEKPFSEDEPQNMFFSLIVDTEKSFAETIEFYKKIGFPLTSQIFMLRYGRITIQNMGDGFLDRLEKIAEGSEGIPHAAKTVSDYGQEDASIKYHQSPFLFGHLNPDFILEINNHPGRTFMRLHGEQGTEWENVALFYEQNTVKGVFDEEKRQRHIGCMDSKIVQPRFDQILSASPFKLNEKEQIMLESMINQALGLAPTIKI